MTTLGSNYEITELPSGQVQHTVHLKPIAYLNNGTYQYINPAWQDGDETYPHIVTAAPLMVSSDPTGGKRLHPTREQDVFITLGRIWHRPAGTWVQAPMNALTRSGNVLTSVNTNYDLKITMIGHGLKFDLVGKGGFWPNGSTIAFPASLTGLTRTGSTIYKNGVPVALLRAPVVYDANDATKTLPIGISFGTFGSETGVIFALPTPAQLTTAGITAPVIDPTLDLQPDGTAGLDNWVGNGAATTNNGTATDLRVGEQVGVSGNFWRTLIKFDLSSIPAAAVISAASLSLYASADHSGNARTFQIYRQKRAWVEAQSTWNIYSTGNDWQTAGGFGADDCEQTGIGSRAFTATETLNEFKVFTLTPTSVSGLDLGNGWLIKADTELDDGYIFASSDNATAANRPKLSITYTEAAGNALNSFRRKRRGRYKGA